MLRETGLDLQKALDICRAAESTKVQMREMTHPDTAAVNEIKTLKSGFGPRKSTHSAEKRSCYTCGAQGHLSTDCNSGR